MGYAKNMIAGTENNGKYSVFNTFYYLNAILSSKINRELSRSRRAMDLGHKKYLRKLIESMTANYDTNPMPMSVSHHQLLYSNIALKHREHIVSYLDDKITPT